MNRAGIIPPAVTITADDKRLEKGKPAPDLFLLAADCLGYDPKNCVIFGIMLYVRGPFEIHGDANLGVSSSSMELVVPR